MKMIKTNPKMNEVVKETLKMRGDNMSLYALKRIEELEEQVNRVSGIKFFCVESGGDWADASVEYFVNLTDRLGKEIHKEYEESGGYYGNGKKWFRDWAIEKGYMREPSESELETYYDG